MASNGQLGRLRKAGWVVLGQDMLRPRGLWRVGIVLVALSLAIVAISVRPDGEDQTDHDPDRRAVTTVAAPADALDDTHRDRPSSQTTTTEPAEPASAERATAAPADATPSSSLPAAAAATAPTTTGDGSTTTGPSPSALTSLRGRIVYDATGEAPPGLYSAALDGSDGRLLLGPPDGHTLSWPDVSNDGMKVAYVRGGVSPEQLEEIHVVGFDGRGDVRLPLPDDHWGRPRFSPDGTQLIAMAEFGKLWIIDAGGTNPRPLTLDVDAAEYDAVSWAPDGARLAVNGTGADGTGIYVVDIATGSAQLLPADGGYSAMSPAWSPDGLEVAYEVYDGTLSWLASTNVATGVTRKIADGILQFPSWSQDSGTLVITVGTGPHGWPELWAVDRSGAHLRPLGLPGISSAQ
jgi:WD40 repeat protein